MIVRPATLADMPELLQLEQSGFPQDTWGIETLGAELQRPNTVYLVAEVDGQVVGSALGWWILDELEVMRVSVAPKARRCGAGRALLSALETKIPGISVSLLEVREDNTGAIALYEGSGYRQNGRRKRYYHDGCDARLYRKELTA